MNTAALAEPVTVPEGRRELRLLSFNIQAGSSVHRYRQYLTRGWQHVLPHPAKTRNLRQVADVVADFDLVALQEADGGSLRSGFRNQVEFLAETAGFPYWSHQANRNVAKLAESSNGLLSRHEPTEVLDHRLPGPIPGRGALEVRFGSLSRGLRVFIAHLALTPRVRRLQLGYLAEEIGDHPNVVLMGDLNCRVDSAELRGLFARTALVPPTLSPHTFPSWRPRRDIDHILVGADFAVLGADALPLRVSDHLPLAVTVRLPRNCEF